MSEDPRFTSLKLRPKSTTPRTSVEPAPEPEPKVEPEPERSDDDGGVRGSSRPRKPNATAATKARVALLLPAELYEQLSAHTTETRASFRAVILRAVETAYEDKAFDRLLAEHRRALAAPVVSGGGLFSSQAPRPKPAPKMPIEFKVDHGDLRILKSLRTEVGAKDRTELLVVALRHYFATTADQ